MFNSEVSNEEDTFLLTVDLIPKAIAKMVLAINTKNNRIPSIAEKNAEKNDTPFSSNPTASISPSQT
jgi:hypothetical protein